MKNNIPQGYKATPLGIIPQEWEVRRLGDLCCNQGDYGINAPAVAYSNDLPTYLRITDISDDGKFIIDNKASVNSPNSESYHLKEGDIVFARTGATVGKTYLYDPADGDLVFAGFLIRFSPNEQKIVPYYLKTYTNTAAYWYWVKIISQRSGQPGINAAEYSSLQLPVPPLAEQKKIAEVLGVWDKAIEKQSQLIEQLTLRKRGLMQQLLTGKKRLPGFSGEWRKEKAGSIFENSSVRSNKLEPLLSATQEYGVVPRDMLETRVTMPSGNLSSFKRVDIGDFVISLRSFEGGIEYSKYSGIISPAYTVLKKKHNVNDIFYKAYFKSHEFIQRLAIAVIGIRDGKQISYSDFCYIRIPLPSFEEQTAIAEVLTAADREIELAQQKLELLRQQKRGLMQQLLTGKKRVKY
ncbi:restriction endonuclease subunit S [Barnesiella viscericola]|uniref:Restriction endonuclease subunit S n=1 Tax=Barnesiella viscericola TaxID=397865 RepID=A0A921SU63_9BACT|nr:restriction endonuclease subunit S [Barnesiella viscericola]HJG87982.1 restriction endonuclease subunit S [Barnesiella viscericola]